MAPGDPAQNQQKSILTEFQAYGKITMIEAPRASHLVLQVLSLCSVTSGLPCLSPLPSAHFFFFRTHLHIKEIISFHSYSAKKIHEVVL